ncbi:MAG: hypothetical protein HKN91_06260 [Acidimicrobiia bacterium]|nr:hypothetical protein [Acidimicrobiia bacterium]
MVGKEAARPPAGTTTATHCPDFKPGDTETYPMVELKLTVERVFGLCPGAAPGLDRPYRFEAPGDGLIVL